MLLRKKDKQTLSEIFSSVTFPIEVWAYGSRVNGSAHDGSDLDLVVRDQTLKPISADTMIDLIEKIRESNIPILVELRDWSRLPASFHKNIERQYEVLFTNASLMMSES
ncbi:nucleotidyltransferase family protein [Dyadobacter sp. CY343]|uniref:nucleotidyltransferase family protein n=1 Tax=Dyadobacter sp. CY343 TaxID=2907299 RepID=UPI001F2042D5|nr:nucleotidyltransferase domain-containing protein [Dyadobacter sp. CY343]MCE7060663.1 nucleotidyltransferase domain-containing protein [Dyadobacter sp. CY343]